MAATLASLYEQAGVQRFTYPRATVELAAAEYEISLARGLLQMRHAGLFVAVWIDAGLIRVQEQLAPYGEAPMLRSLTRLQAAKLVEAFEELEPVRKPAKAAPRGR